MPLLPGLPSFSTSLQQSPPPAGMLLICKGKWSNINEIYLQTGIGEIEEIFSYVMYPRLHTSVPVSLRGSTPKFISKTPALFQQLFTLGQGTLKDKKTLHAAEEKEKKKKTYCYLRKLLVCLH